MRFTKSTGACSTWWHGGGRLSVLVKLDDGGSLISSTRYEFISRPISGRQS
ncbi:hypothetical protein [Paenibacillus sp. ISL-20]|uniref:hypothetical protein n=1 Tax=Paenibacillus sp. ISL-20 TaxID=2819163 RepID=UPI001BEAFD8D|nr:hypothetical protein [Paenibacillus sp. ISL-20]